MVNKGSGEVVFRIGFVQVPKIHTYVDSSLILIYGNGVGNPFGQGNWVDESNIEKFL
jgi:hypothetical protein